MSQLVANIHDAFCKQALGDPRRAKQFLREHLPPAVAALLSDQPPEPVSDAGFLVSQLIRIRYKRGTDG